MWLNICYKHHFNKLTDYLWAECYQPQPSDPRPTYSWWQCSSYTCVSTGGRKRYISSGVKWLCTTAVPWVPAWQLFCVYAFSSLRAIMCSCVTLVSSHRESCDSSLLLLLQGSNLLLASKTKLNRADFRTPEQLRWDRASGDHRVQLPAQGGTLRASCAAWLWSISQGWRWHSLSGQAGPVPSHPHNEKVFPDDQTQLPVLPSVPPAAGPGTGCHWEEPGSVCFAPSLQAGRWDPTWASHTDEIPPQAFLLVFYAILLVAFPDTDTGENSAEGV